MNGPATRLAAQDLLTELCARRVATRLWAHDVTLWAPAVASPAQAEVVRQRLGWLRVPWDMAEALPSVTEFAQQVRADGLAHTYLLGMGGSSLCAIVLREVLGVTPGAGGVTVVDTTDERSVRALLEGLDPARTLVVVSSKSGTTVEVDALARLFAAELRRSLAPPDVARRFVAITDPGTPLDQNARGFRRVFHAGVDIGGRFAALSVVGLLPAALMGHPLAQLLRSARQMAEQCRSDDPTNPALALAAFVAAGVRAGRDKLTLLISEPLDPLGLWIEQLVAESTGKHGRGVLPVVDEPWDFSSYGLDRVFVVLRVPEDDRLAAVARTLDDHGHPTYTLATSAEELGGEFFRWEFATAVVGALLDVNPFDEPDVQAAKDATAALLAAYERTGRLPDTTPDAEAGGLLAWSPLAHQVGELRTPTELVRAALSTVRPGDYVAWLSYLPPDERTSGALRHIRQRVARLRRVATTFGVGPRYLHSTGQYHKGGPNRGVFFLLTADDLTETPVPERPYSLAVLKRAQAIGDYRALADRGRRVVRLHCPADPLAQAALLERVFDEALA